jgi:hypothetical protein
MPGDDEIDRRLRELLEEVPGPSRIREPSAAEREKAARKSQRRGRRSSGRRRRVGRTIGWSAVVVVVLAGGVAFGWQHFPRSGAGGPKGSAGASPAPEGRSA